MSPCLKDGNIAVYNLERRGSTAPVFVSGPRVGKHRETVWQVKTDCSQISIKTVTSNGYIMGFRVHENDYYGQNLNIYVDQGKAIKRSPQGTTGF